MPLGYLLAGVVGLNQLISPAWFASTLRGYAIKLLIRLFTDCRQMACQHLTQVLGSHWLAQKTIHTGFCGKLAVSSRGIGRQGNNRQLLRASNMFLIRRVASKPSMSGMPKSMNTKSKAPESSATSLWASTPEPATETLSPIDSRTLAFNNLLISCLHQQHTTIEQHRAVNGQTCSTFHIGIGWRVIQGILKLVIVPAHRGLHLHATAQRLHKTLYDVSSRPVPCCFRADVPVANG